MTSAGTGMPALRQPRSPCTWVMVVEPSSKSFPSLAPTYPHPPHDVCALHAEIHGPAQNLRQFLARALHSSSSPSTWDFGFDVRCYGLTKRISLTNLVLTAIFRTLLKNSIFFAYFFLMIPRVDRNHHVLLSPAGGCQPKNFFIDRVCKILIIQISR